MREHINDTYVQLASKEGWRSRAAFKLMEIDDKDLLLKRGEVVVDLGATPGGWSQVAVKRVGDGGLVFASTCWRWSLSMACTSFRAIFARTRYCISWKKNWANGGSAL
jgi:23S rRNA U2552 (ribose-2'-O)-methylase RlmE/FtsJ